jgi:hypothetical protein
MRARDRRSSPQVGGARESSAPRGGARRSLIRDVPYKGTRHSVVARGRQGAAGWGGRSMTLEQAIAYIQDDELVEVTPRVIRIRKRYLDPHERKRQSRKAEAA